MNYSEQLLNDIYYMNICSTFTSIASENIKPTLQELLYFGHVGSYRLSSDIQHKDNPDIEKQRRLSMAYLLLNNPETFEFFKNNNINIFHGTNANALASIAKYGLCSVNYLKSSNIDITTGEEWSRIQGKRSFVSFTDVLEIAEEYSTINDEKNILSFPVIICTTTEELRKKRIVPISSDISEIAIDIHLPLESIKCICVPHDRVSFAKRIINNVNIPVLPISNTEKKFYYVDDLNICHFMEEEYRKWHQSNTQNQKYFTEEDVLNMSTTRNIFNIKNVLNKIRAFFHHKENIPTGDEIYESKFRL